MQSIAKLPQAKLNGARALSHSLLQVLFLSCCLSQHANYSSSRSRIRLSWVSLWALPASRSLLASRHERGCRDERIPSHVLASPRCLGHPIGLLQEMFARVRASLTKFSDSPAAAAVVTSSVAWLAIAGWQRIQLVFRFRVVLLVAFSCTAKAEPSGDASRSCLCLCLCLWLGLWLCMEARACVCVCVCLLSVVA